LEPKIYFHILGLGLVLDTSGLVIIPALSNVYTGYPLRNPAGNNAISWKLSGTRNF